MNKDEPNNIKNSSLTTQLYNKIKLEITLRFKNLINQMRFLKRKTTKAQRHKLTNEPIDVFVSLTQFKPTFNINYRAKQIVLLINDADTFLEQYSDEWIQHMVDNNYKFLTFNHTVMDEYVINLN